MNRALPLILTLTACGAPTYSLFGDLPDDAAFVAATFEDEAGDFVAGTPILLLGSAAIRSAVEDTDDAAHRVILHAWSASLERPDGVEELQVAYASELDPVLPMAEWSGARLVDAPGPVIETSAKALTAPWLPRCPTLLPENNANRANVRCLVSPCGLPPEQRDCEVILDLEGCGLERFRLTVDGRGRIEPTPMDGRTCRVPDPVPPTVAAFDCASCPIELYSTPSDEPPFAAVQKFSIAPSVDVPGLREFAQGRTSSVLLLGDQLVVAALLDGPLRTECGGATGRSQLFSFDVQTRAVTPTAIVDGCLHRLSRDPAGDGFVALDYATFPRAVVRYDSRWREIERLSLDEFATSDPVVEPNVMITLGDQIVILAAGEGRPSKLSFLRAAPLGIVETVPTEDRHAYALHALGAQVAVGQNGFVAVFDVDTRTMVERITLGPGDGINRIPVGLTYVAAAERFVTVSNSARGGMIFTSRDITPIQTRFYPFNALPTAIASVGDEPLALVVVVDRDNGSTSLALADVAGSRFLPNVVELDARGPFTNLVQDRFGAFWGSASWEGAVFVVDLEPR